MRLGLNRQELACQVDAGVGTARTRLRVARRPRTPNSTFRRRIRYVSAKWIHDPARRQVENLSYRPGRQPDCHAESPSPCGTTAYDVVSLRLPMRAAARREDSGGAFREFFHFRQSPQTIAGKPLAAAARGPAHGPRRRTSPGRLDVNASLYIITVIPEYLCQSSNEARSAMSAVSPLPTTPDRQPPPPARP